MIIYEVHTLYQQYMSYLLLNPAGARSTPKKSPFFVKKNNLWMAQNLLILSPKILVIPCLGGNGRSQGGSGRNLGWKVEVGYHFGYQKTRKPRINGQNLSKENQLKWNNPTFFRRCVKKTVAEQQKCYAVDLKSQPFFSVEVNYRDIYLDCIKYESTYVRKMSNQKAMEKRPKIVVWSMNRRNRSSHFSSLFKYYHRARNNI